MSDFLTCRLNYRMSVAAQDGRLIIAGLAEQNKNGFVETISLGGDSSPIVGLTNITDGVVHVHTLRGIYELVFDHGFLVQRIGSMP